MKQEINYYRKRIYKVAIFIEILVFCVEVSIFFLLGVHKASVEDQIQYILIRIVLPNFINISLIISCNLANKYIEESNAFLKNLLPVMLINAQCLVISYAHGFFSMTFIIYWLPIFLSVAFSNKKLTNITTHTAILFLHIAIIHRYLVPPDGDTISNVVCDYLIALVIIVVSYLMAGVIIEQINDKNEKLAVAAKEATEANNAKTTFLTNVSHEIRTPINAIIGMDEMILRDSKDKETLEHASDINNAAHLLLSIINEILDLSKIDSGKMEIVKCEYDLAKMITDCVNVIIFQTRAKGLVFDLKMDPDLPRVLYGDELRIKQVISNLLSNAYKYTKSGGIKLTVKGVVFGDELDMSVCVEDTGSGIAKEDLDKLFEKFERLDINSNHKIEGTGLGLAIANGILGLMGSAIEVSSELGKGSKFSFRIVQKIIDKTSIGNITYENESKKNATLHHVSIVAPKASILVVDDNAINLKVLTGLLSPTQISFDTASSGPQGLRMAAKKKYDLIFMDHLMPDMDGVEAFHELRNDLTSESKDTPCVILTANAVSGAKDFYINEGFDGFLAKPVSLKNVEKVLVELLPPYLVSEKVDSEEEVVYERADVSELGFPEVPGVDWSKGITCTGSKDSLISTINDFVTVSKNNIRFLDECLANNDYEQFRIKIHSIKGLAATIGNVSLSELARIQEYAARDGQYDKIVSLYPVFKDELLRYKDVMQKEVLPSEEKAVLESTDMLVVLLQMLKGAIQMNDIEMADNYSNQIRNYSYEEELSDKIDDLVVYVTNLDNDKALDSIDSIIAMI